jgi:two-component system, chemotaxis family, sensor kinase CheA
MNEHNRRMRSLFRATALEQIARLLQTTDELRRGVADPEVELAIGPTLHLMKGDAALVGMREIAAALHAAESRAAEAAWDALAAALTDVARELGRGGDNELDAAAPDGPAVLRGWVRLQTDEIGELSDRLLELTTAYHRLAAGLVRAVRDAPTDALLELAEDADAARRQLDEVLGAAWSLRLASLEDLLHRLARHATELARAQGKSLEVRPGGSAELERSMVEAIEEPLLVLVRGLIAQGIEEPGARGDKPAQATLVFAARLAGGAIEISLEDDGRGVEPAALPGLDAVRARFELFGGSIALSPRPGHGTRCVLTVPAAIGRERAILVECAGGVFALPARAVSGQLRIGDHARRRIAGGTAIRVGDAWLPLCRLDDALELGAGTGTGDDLPALVLEGGGRRRAFAVDRIAGEDELLRRPANALSELRELVVASSVIDDGRVALWPAVPALLGGRGARSQRGRRVTPPAMPRVRRVLVADDSPIVLEIVTSILRGAELLPQAACDGEAAWEALEEELPDLLLTDVDMPRLDGLGLLRRVRARWPRLPVVMLTTRGTDEDRGQAMSLGANAYLVKAELDEGRLIETVCGLIDASGKV